MEEKQKLYKLLRNLNFNGESGSEPYTPTSQSIGGSGPMDGFFSPELRGEFGAGLLDLHAMDDTELLSEVSFHKIGESVTLSFLFILFTLSYFDCIELLTLGLLPT